MANGKARIMIQLVHGKLGIDDFIYADLVGEGSKCMLPETCV